ncbi:MAG: hypothetical protein RMM58_13615 [Chloroflexota bacterium]|nr:hypothetical protein [Dehalococcoidia bacterium]MDW8254908.1 hypothetical protein [Chloroflexota bacterium]
MNGRRDQIEEIIRLIQERMEAAGVRRVTDLPRSDQEELVRLLQAALQKPAGR